MGGKVAVIFFLILVVGAGGFYLGQKYKLVPTTQTSVPVIVTSEPTPTAMVTGVTSTPVPSPTVDETAAVVAAVKASEVARIGSEANNSQYLVTLIQGNYAKGMAGGQGGGAQWFAAKVNGLWKVVFIGNGAVQCADLASYPNFPNTMIPECWNGTKTITR